MIRSNSLALSVALLAAFALSAHAQEPIPTDPVYRAPDADLAQVVEAPPTPGVSLAPDRSKMLLLHRPALPPIAELAEEELRLAGVRIKPATNGPSRSQGYTGITIKDMDGAADLEVSGLPPGGRLGEVRWSEDGRWLAFLVTLDDHIELWGAPVATGQARRLVDGAVNDTYGGAYDWVDETTLVAKMIPPGRGEAPATEVRVPTGPTIQQNLGESRPARTYQDLLQNATDEELFDYYFTSQLVRIGLDGSTMELGEPGVFVDVSPSPDGTYLLVEWLHRPYSYQVPASRFPRMVQVWDGNGETVHQVVDQPLADNIPVAFGSVETGPRSVSWRADVPATLVWAEARDGGDAGVEAEVRDEVLMLPAPFNGEPVSLAELGNRYAGVMWKNGEMAALVSFWWQTRNQKIILVEPDDPSAEQTVLFDFSYQDRYNNPGSPLMEQSEFGTSVLRTSDDGRFIYLSGGGASPEGDRPFLDRMDLRTMETERLFRSEAPYYTYPYDILDEDDMTILVSRESKTEPANFFKMSLESDETVALTDFPHPYPAMLDVNKELITYEREDGVGLSGTLYTPPGWTPEDGPLPTLFWAYPTEYKSADAAGQVQGSPYRFTRVYSYSPLMWVLKGYAIFDDPQIPIIGEGEEQPNDTYVKQLVDGAEAAVKVLVERGVTDPARTAIGGHSYGAFMTANLLAHSDLFRAGIARSGAYNRTLTPFGFQAEERTFWEAPEVYFAMSPFMNADKINEPMLMIHGEADNNSGTFPMQSERMYAAMKGLGGTARLVMLPFESHGYRARESVLHTVWEMDQWLERFVKGAQPRDIMPEEREP